MFVGEISEFDPAQDPDEKSSNQSLRDIIYGEPPKTRGLDQSGAIPEVSSKPGSVKEAMRLYAPSPKDSVVAQDRAPEQNDLKVASHAARKARGDSADVTDTSKLLSRPYYDSYKIGNETFIYNKTPWTGEPGRKQRFQ